MKFNPLTEDELNQSFQLLKDGEYDFTVFHAEEKISNQGKEYIFLKLQVWDDAGMERLIFTNLALMKLLKHFCDVTGLGPNYQHGEVHASDCLNKSGRCLIVTEQGKAKPEGGYYPDRNVVKDYIYKLPSTPSVSTNFKDSELPF